MDLLFVVILICIVWCYVQYKLHHSEINRINIKYQEDLKVITRNHNKELSEITRKCQENEKEIDFLQKTLNSPQQTLPVIAELVSSAREETCLSDANYLCDKKNPAYKAADKLRMYAPEIRQWS